jgi:site-specific DNA recombinase
MPALVDPDTWDQANAQLVRNNSLSFRNNSKYGYLLRCLLTCKVCDLAIFGRSYPARADQPERHYYQWHGKDCIRPGFRNN